jgi:hypothetical protein
MPLLRLNEEKHRIPQTFVFNVRSPKKMKTEESTLQNIEVVSDAPKHNPKHLARLARVCGVATAIAIVPVHSVLADADDQGQQILPFPTVAESTIPTNGDSCWLLIVRRQAALPQWQNRAHY